MDGPRILSQVNLPTAPGIPIVEDDSCLGLSASLSAIRNSYTKYLNYNTDYISSWGCHEAFRELYQNWRDGILRSANLHLSQFKTTYTEEKRVILVQVQEPKTERLLGFIRFEYNKDGLVVGGLKMANFNASLKYEVLGTGGTTKANDSGQTGQHGEGMKLSALVYRRNNYNLRIESSGFKWNFIFKKGELACQLSRIKDESLAVMKMEAEAQGPLRGTIAHPWEDVCVIIGAQGDARTIDGRKVPGARIHVDDFKNWLKVTLDINPPTKIIKTIKGDLIRDPSYRSQMYLRGLLLPTGGISGKEYSYGYNFIDGSTSRDRHSLTSSSEESMRIASIWAAAIRADDSEDSEIVTEYTNLLLNSLNTKGDAILSSARNCPPKDVAKRVWTQMLKMNKDTQGRQAFYYCACEGKDDVQTIEQSFRMNPVPLDKEMWNILNKYHLCRTPADELTHRFRFAKVVPVPDNNFAAHMSRMLRSLLQSTPDMNAMEITFVDGEHLQIDAAFVMDTWRIHDKWLTFDGAHEHTFCETLSPEEDGLFLCDHAVLQLWDILLLQLIGTGKHTRIATDAGWLKSMARGRLAQMPRSVKCATTDGKGELLVTWKSADSYQHRDKEIKVVLHIETCTEAQSQDILRSSSDDEYQCNCPSQLSQSVSDGVTFVDLNLDQNYLPSISRNTDGAFIGLQPSPVRPRTASLVVTPKLETSSSPKTGSAEGEGENVINFDNSANDRDVNDEEEHDDDNGDDDTYQPPLNTLLSRLGVTKAAPIVIDDTSPVSYDAHLNDAASTPPPVLRIVTSPPKEFMKATVVPSADTFILGPKIEHRSLDWGGSFPGSHDFHRTSNASNEDVFILKPKSQRVNKNGKRVRDPEEEPRAARAKSKQPRCEDVVNDSADEGAPSLTPRHP